MSKIVLSVENCGVKSQVMLQFSLQITTISVSF